MSTSALPTFTNAVITAFRNASSLSGIRIFDGIEIDQSYPGNAIVVGTDGSMEGDDVLAGSARQEYKQLGAISKFEDGAITCTLWAANGGTNLTTLRATAFSILGSVETIIRSDVSFGSVVMYSGIDSYQMGYRQTTVGAAVVINFTITYRAKI
jgi:hypothetical protein